MFEILCDIGWGQDGAFNLRTFPSLRISPPLHEVKIGLQILIWCLCEVSFGCICNIEKEILKLYYCFLDDQFWKRRLIEYIHTNIYNISITQKA